MFLGPLLGLALFGAPAGAAEVPFAPPSVVSGSAAGAASVFAADLDGDGDQDLLSASSADDKIAWHENNGASPPGFTTHIIVDQLSGADSAAGARSVFAADLDGDGDLDVLSASHDDDKIAWYENDGVSPPGFTPHVIVDQLSGTDRADGAASVFALDLDRDGDLDVLSASSLDNKVAWYENDGASTPAFTVRVVATGVVGARSVQAADVDRDGDPDVVSAACGDGGAILGEVTWYESDGAATPLFTRRTVAGGLACATSVAMADVNRDGALDILAATRDDDTVSWYESDGAALPSFTARIVSTGAAGAASVTAADVNGDGHIDVLSASEDDDTIAWHENDGGTIPSFTKRDITTQAAGALSVCAGDLDTDGDVDVAYASAGDDSVAWSANVTIHRSMVFPSRSAAAGQGQFWDLAVADLDADGDKDFLSGALSADRLAWIENDGSPPATWTVRGIDFGRVSFSVAAVDLNADGDLDVLAASSGGSGVGWYESDGASPPIFTRHAISPATEGSWWTAAADMDGDGDLDVISASSLTPEVLWYESDGADPPAFTSRSVSAALTDPRAVFPADLDGDGDMDVLAAGTTDDTIAWYENDGASPPAWAPHTINSSADGATSVLAVDLDRDGDLDVLATAMIDDTLTWFENDGASPPAWTERTISSSLDGANHAVPADVDADGDLDILATAFDGDTVSLFESTGPPYFNFIERSIDTSVNGAQAIAITDVDLDGDLDLLASGRFEVGFPWYENRGGQFYLTTTDTAPAEVLEGDVMSFLTVDLSHRGRSGDGDMELSSMTLLLEESQGVPMTSEQANTRFDRLLIYQDEVGFGFDPEQDALAAAIDTFTLTSGVQEILFADGDPAVQLIHGYGGKFFVVLEIAAPEGSALLPGTFRLRHYATLGTAEDRDHDVPLLPEHTSDLISGLVTILPPPALSFAGHGLSSAALGIDRILDVDLDGDGDQDLLSAWTGSDTVVWFENDGSPDPSWTQRTIDSFTVALTDVHAADLDGDADMDVLVTTYTDDTVAWYENDGSAPPVFSRHVITEDPDGNLGPLEGFANRVHLVSAADMDGDGDMDVLSGSGSSNASFLAWYENSGTTPPTFVPSAIGPTLDYLRDLDAADLDGDGDMDLLSAHESDSTILWYSNDGQPTPGFASQVIVDESFGDDRPSGVQDIHVGDVDGDGDLDVLSASWRDDKIAWYENDGLPLPSFTPWPIGLFADYAEGVFAADMDADGDLDVLSASQGDETIAWYENNGAAPPLFKSHIIAANVSDATLVHAADLDNDGDTDVISGSYHQDLFRWHENELIHRSGSFPVQSPLTADVRGVASVHVADLDRDGDPDVLTAGTSEGGTGSVKWYAHSGDPSPSFTGVMITTATLGATDAFVADVDGDGHPDVISSSAGDDKIAWYRSDGLAFPTFSTQIVVDASSGSDRADGAQAAAAADLDGDGDMDLLSASFEDDRIAWYENDGATPPSVPGFTVHTITELADGARDLAVADMDGDGDPDVVSASELDDKIAWHENDGGAPPAFTSHTIVDSGSGPERADGARAVFTADLDRDGDVDVLSASADDGRIVWYENDGLAPPSFTVRTIASGLPSARFLFALDLDLDGDLDVAAASETGDRVVWYESDGAVPPAFVAHLVPAPLAAPACLAPGDLDRDGQADILAGSGLITGGSLVWYENRGGQFALPTDDTAPGTLGPGGTEDLLRITANHNGRLGDLALELVSLEMILLEGPDDPLTSAEANAIIDNLRIHLDDGSGVFEPGVDTLVTQVDDLTLSASGLLTVPFGNNYQSVKVLHGTARRYFVVVELTAGADNQSVGSFSVTHVTESSSRAQERLDDIPLLLEYDANLTSGLVTIPGVAAGAVPDGATVGGTPLTIVPGSGDSLDLSWGASCLPGDADYAVYEGTIGDFTSHVARLCTTGGSTTVSIVPLTDSAYFLVVPRSSNREGSYGLDHEGLERPRSLSACLPQQIGTCP